MAKHQAGNKALHDPDHWRIPPPKSVNISYDTAELVQQ